MINTKRSYNKDVAKVTEFKIIGENDASRSVKRKFKNDCEFSLIR